MTDDDQDSEEHRRKREQLQKVRSVIQLAEALGVRMPASLVPLILNGGQHGVLALDLNVLDMWLC